MNSLTSLKGLVRLTCCDPGLCERRGQQVPQPVQRLKGRERPGWPGDPALGPRAWILNSGAMASPNSQPSRDAPNSRRPSSVVHPGNVRPQAVVLSIQPDQGHQHFQDTASQTGTGDVGEERRPAACTFSFKTTGRIRSRRGRWTWSTSPQIHQEFTLRHRGARRTPAESEQGDLTSGKEYIEPRKTRKDEGSRGKNRSVSRTGPALGGRGN